VKTFFPLCLRGRYDVEYVGRAPARAQGPAEGGWPLASMLYASPAAQDALDVPQLLIWATVAIYVGMSAVRTIKEAVTGDARSRHPRRNPRGPAQ